MRRLALRMSLAAALLLAAAAFLVVPGGLEAARFLAAADAPEELADLGLAHRFDADTARREIEAALAAGDSDLATSFLALAQARGVEVAEPQRQAVADAVVYDQSAAATAMRFGRGFLTGGTDDAASLAGTVAGDLFVFGDVRDLVRETAQLARGEQADELILGLSSLGLAITAGTYVSLGAAAPARAGVSALKAASKGGRLSAGLTQAVARPLRELVDTAALRRSLGPGALVQPAVALRGAREAVKADKARGLVRLAGDIGAVQGKAGTRAALDGLRIAQSGKDVTRLARLAAAKGPQTRAILKILGRGAIALTIGAWQLASWLFWAVLMLAGFCVSMKRTAEHVAQSVIDAGKRRRALRAAAAAAAAAA